MPLNNAMFNMLQQFVGRLPQNFNPREVVQNMLNSGKLSQQQFNALRQKAQEIQNNPMFAQMFGATK